jgi:hypothetical protein
MDSVAHYEMISSEIIEICGPQYVEAQLYGDLSANDVAGIKLKCKNADGSENSPRVGGMPAFKISKALMNLQSEMTIPGQKPWSRCTFTLFPDGKFKFDVEYDD